MSSRFSEIEEKSYSMYGGWEVSCASRVMLNPRRSMSVMLKAVFIKKIILILMIVG